MASGGRGNEKSEDRDGVVARAVIVRDREMITTDAWRETMIPRISKRSCGRLCSGWVWGGYARWCAWCAHKSLAAACLSTRSSVDPTKPSQASSLLLFATVAHHGDWASGGQSQGERIHPCTDTDARTHLSPGLYNCSQDETRQDDTKALHSILQVWKRKPPIAREWNGQGDLQLGHILYSSTRPQGLKPARHNTAEVDKGRMNTGLHAKGKLSRER